MQDQLQPEREFEWLDHVQPVGLVFARSLLKALGLSPERQTKSEEDSIAELLNPDPEKPALKNAWAMPNVSSVGNPRMLPAFPAARLFLPI